jgi:acetylornithine deacetylase/succinyl-diaminopimelate desuccinylase-like protein
MTDALQHEAITVLQRLLRMNTVNPPGNERPAQELLEALLAGAGFETHLLGDDPARPNLVARLAGRGPGPVLGLLSHVDTVVADPVGWRHSPWSGELDEGCVWGRGALDMKSQTAAEAVAAASLAREGWRPERGDLLVISVCDEEVAGTGAAWLTAEHPELVRCDYLLNEGGGESFEIDGRRAYTASVGEKGVFRFTLTTEGAAGHASLPSIADNALLKLAPLLEALGERQPAWDVTPAPRALLTISSR